MGVVMTSVVASDGGGGRGGGGAAVVVAGCCVGSASVNVRARNVGLGLPLCAVVLNPPNLCGAYSRNEIFLLWWCNMVVSDAVQQPSFRDYRGLPGTTGGQVLTQATGQPG